MSLKPATAGAAAGLAAVGSYWGVAAAASRPGRRFVGGTLLSRVPTDRAVVALTFDDGPDPDYTARFVDALKGARSTFFLLGERARRWPELARLTLAEGHELASHGDRHERLTRLTPRATVRDLTRGHQAVVDATGVAPRFYRPPHGLFNLAAWVQAPRLGMRRTLWSSSAHDWEQGATPAAIAGRVLDAAAPGAIILMHDSGGWPDRPSGTLGALPMILDGLEKRGLTPVPLGELVASGNGCA